jgi:hypothetical protein
MFRAEARASAAACAAHSSRSLGAVRLPLEFGNRNKALILPGFVLVVVSASSPLRQLFHSGCLHTDDILIASAAGIVCIVGVAAAKRLSRH